MIPLYIGIPVIIGSGVLGGLASYGLMRLAMCEFGHEGYVKESAEQRAARVYMEHTKQGMRE